MDKRRRWEPGDIYTSLYSRWHSMKKRCYSPSDKGYKHYGARGISICDQWRKDFSAFKRWAISSGFKEELKIDRIDVNGNYCPENCRWVDDKRNARNRRITLRAETGETLSDLAEKYGIHYQTLYWRIVKSKLPLEKALVPV